MDQADWKRQLPENVWWGEKSFQRRITNTHVSSGLRSDGQKGLVFVHFPEIA